MSRIETIEVTDELHAQITEAAERREREWQEEAAERLLTSFGPADTGWYVQRIIELEAQLRASQRAQEAGSKAWRAVATYMHAVAFSGAALVDMECGVSEDGGPFVVVVLEPRPPESVFVSKAGVDHGHAAFVERIEKQVCEAHPDLAGVRVLSVRQMDYSREGQ